MSKNLLIDFYKGVGIFLVVFGHSIQFSDPFYTNNFWYNIIYKFHMPLFFFISGFNSKWIIDFKGVVYSLKSRINRVLYPFLVWTIIFYFIIKIFRCQELRTLLEFNFAIYWFLPVLFSIWFLFMVFSYLLKNRHFLYLFFFVLLFFCSFIYGGFWINSIGYYLVFFVSGFYLKRWVDFEISVFHFFLLVLIFSGIIFLFSNYIFNTVNLLFIKIAFLLVVLMMLKFLFSRFYYTRFFCVLGESSLEIYLLHIFIVFVLNALVHLKSINSVFLSIVLCCTSYILVLLIRRFTLIRRLFFNVQL